MRSTSRADEAGQVAGQVAGRVAGRVVVVGSVNVDLFAHVAHHPVPGETIIGSGGDRAPGGKGANQALAARLQGAPVALVGAVGDDPDAELALRLLAAAGTDLAAVQRLAGTPTGLAIITVSADGENTIVVLPGANAALDPGAVRRAVAALTPDDLVLLQGELPLPLVAEVVREAASAGHRVVLNLAPYAELPADALRLADPLVVNELEGASVAAQLACGGADEAATAAALVAAGVRSVVMTLGPRGALVADSDGVTAVPSPRVAAVDTTGAGDAFTGALCARLLAGDGLVSAAEHAARVGAHAVQHPGAQPSYPSLEEPLPR